MSLKRIQLAFSLAFLFFIPASFAELSKIEISERETLSDAAVGFTYERITGVMYFTIDPNASGNQEIADIEFAPTNAAGLVEFSTDFKLLVPSADIANGSLVYMVNNRGGGSVAPEQSLSEHPLSAEGFTYLLTGWINEISSAPGRLRLHAPIVSYDNGVITGPVRYEIGVNAPAQRVEIAGAGHLAYEPSPTGFRSASLTRRQLQEDPRIPLERSQFNMEVERVADSNQPIVTVELAGGFEPGLLYELIYEAQNPVLSGAGMAGIRDAISALRYGVRLNIELAGQIASLGIPDVTDSMSYGYSQSGRLLRLFMYDGFNTDLAGRRVFDGVIPFIAGGGFGMFNNRFAMPTRTNGQHENQLYPNDLFPFTYGESTDPFTGETDSILGKSIAAGTAPKVMHIQTSNEYWVRGGSLPHTNPEGTADAVIPDNVRFYSLGGSQHGSGSGQPGAPRGGQLPANPNMWAPFAESLILAMHKWIADDQLPPPSRYPKIADGTLVPSHLSDGQINPDAWRPMAGINHPRKSYVIARGEYGGRFRSERIIDSHPTATDQYYGTLVPAVNSDNNDFKASTVLPPLTSVPLASFLPWNLRAPALGAETELLRLSGAYIPFSRDAQAASNRSDGRNTIDALYSSYQDYLDQYEAATDELIAEGYLLPEYKTRLMAIAEANQALFD